MRFDNYKILSTSSHVGYPIKKNQLLQGTCSHTTTFGNIGKTAFYYQIDWKPFFYGSYLLALVFLYGGHVHLINTKKEWTGFLKNFFEKFQQGENFQIVKKKKQIFLQYLSLNNAEKEDLRDLYLFDPFVFSHIWGKKTPQQRKKKNKKTYPFELLLRQGTIKKNPKQSFSLKRGSIKNTKLFDRTIKSLVSLSRRKKNKKKPLITIHDSGKNPGILSNWTVHVRFSNQRIFVPEKYTKFFSHHKKLSEDLTRCKTQSIGCITANNECNPIPRKKPDILVVLNASHEYGILFESFSQSRPVFGGLATFTNKEWIDFPLNGNDTSLYSMTVWCRWISRMFRYVQLRRFQRKILFFKECLGNPWGGHNKKHEVSRHLQ